MDQPDLQIILVEANDAGIPIETFVAGWITLVMQHGERHQPLTQSMAVGARAASLASQVKEGRGGTVDVLCRCLAPDASTDTMMATGRMLARNELFLEVDREVSPQRASLTPLAWREWDAVPQTRQGELLHAAIVALRRSLR